MENTVKHERSEKYVPQISLDPDFDKSFETSEEKVEVSDFVYEGQEDRPEKVLTTDGTKKGTSISTKETFTCAICNKELSFRYRKRHMATHSGVKDYKCNKCGNAFCDKSNLNTHIKTHAELRGLEDFTCDVCGKQFSQKQYLKNHMIVHSNEKLYKCEICNKDFCRRAELKKHMFIHKGIKNYICDICGKKFSLKDVLKKHINMHIGLKQFKCHICGRAFSQSQGMTAHLIVHTNERKHSCKICQKNQKNFKSKRVLNCHMVIHSRTKGFKCRVCDSEFSRKIDRNQHMLEHKKQIEVNVAEEIDTEEGRQIISEVDPLHIADEVSSIVKEDVPISFDGD